MELTGLQNPMVEGCSGAEAEEISSAAGPVSGGGPAYCGRGSALRRRAEHFYTAIEDDRTRAVLEEAAAKQIKLVCVSDKVLKKLPIPKRRRELLPYVKCAASVWMIFWHPAKCCLFWTV